MMERKSVLSIITQPTRPSKIILPPNSTASTHRPTPVHRHSPRLCVYSTRVWSRDARNPGGPTHAHSTHDDPARVAARVLGIQLMDRSWCTTFDNNSQGGAFLASISRRVEHTAPLCWWYYSCLALLHTRSALPTQQIFSFLKTRFVTS